MTTNTHQRRVLLGPVPCQRCRRLVEYDGIGWLFRGTFLAHVRETCAKPDAAIDRTIAGKYVT